MANNLIDSGKAWLPYFYTDGVWNSNPDIKFNGRQIDDNTKKFMYNFFRFLIDSSFLNKDTITWLKSNLPSRQKAFEFYNSQCDEIDTVNVKTAITNVDYDKNKLLKYFDKDLFVNIMAYPEESLPKANETLDILYRKFFNDKEYKTSMVIKIPNDIVVKSLSDEKFEALEKMLNRYSKKTIRKIESGESEELTPEMMGYYNYIISNKQLNAEDAVRLKRVNSVLGIETKEEE